MTVVLAMAPLPDRRAYRQCHDDNAEMERVIRDKKHEGRVKRGEGNRPKVTVNQVNHISPIRAQYDKDMPSLRGGGQGAVGRVKTECNEEVIPYSNSLDNEQTVKASRIRAL